MKNSNQELHPLHDVNEEDAIGMLIADHKRVAHLFAEFKRLTDEEIDEGKASVVAQICQELTVHTQLEEELFYPAVREATQDEDQVDEAIVEHAGAKQLIAQLMGADPDDELYDAKVTVLGEQIDHHVEEEEGSMFPKARFSGLDTIALGAVMHARKAVLQGSESAKPMHPHDLDDANTDLSDDAERKSKPTVKKKTSTKTTKKPKKKSR